VANADVMVVSNPSVSPGDAQTTAEHAAFAINYATLILRSQTTILAWSQGNLNVQWTLKYWPSTRTNLKNYVTMSPDYDGTVEASFLCDPETLVTQDLGTVFSEFVADDGLPNDLSSILGITNLPTDANQFKYYLLSLLGNSTDSTATVTSATPVSTTLAGDILSVLSIVLT
jgi:hypothetical protein